MTISCRSLASPEDQAQAGGSCSTTCTQTSLALPISTFVSKRDDYKAKLPWKERFAYCLPFDVNYGIRVHGNVDRYNELLPARLVMDEWTEPDYSKEDGKGESPKLLGAAIVASGLQSGSRYALLQCDDPTLVPHSNFLSNKTGGVVSRVDFTASGQTYSHRVSFMSDSTTFYRVVAEAVIIRCSFSPPPPKPILPHSWSGNLTVERRNGGVPEYTGWQYTSYDQCATRTIELNSRMGNHTAIYYHNYGNSTGQCILRDQAPKCSRGFLPVGPCPWGIDALKYASYHGTTPISGNAHAMAGSTIAPGASIMSTPRIICLAASSARMAAKSPLRT